MSDFKGVAAAVIEEIEVLECFFILSYNIDNKIMLYISQAEINRLNI